MKKHTHVRRNFILAVLGSVILAVIAYPKLVVWQPWLAQKIGLIQVNQGLDLQGGIHLEYEANTKDIPSDQVSDALQGAQAVIERRVNAFGVGEPLVQLSKRGDNNRIIVELPGIKNIEAAKAMIQETPFMEFRELAPDSAKEEFIKKNEENKKQAEAVLVRAKAGEDFSKLAVELSQDPSAKQSKGDLGFVKKGALVPEFEEVIFKDDFAPGSVYGDLVESDFGWHIIKKEEVKDPAQNQNGNEAGKEGEEKEVRSAHILFAKDSLENYPEKMYVATGLGGKNVEKVTVDYQSQGLGSPQVLIQFDSEGAEKLAEVSKRNVGKPLAIFIDGQVFSAPTIQQELVGGQAVVTSNFTPETVKEYVKRLNEGALPVPIKLVAQQSIDASLGAEALEQSLFAGFVGLLAVSVFMLLFYRFLGLVAVLALLFYTALLVVIFKFSSLTPFAITVTLSGIAGFVLSIGIAVDANILIFERFREELAFGKSVRKALETAFDRAWPSIRDGHVSTLITTFILMMTGTGFVKGFAIILALGVLVSLFTAVVLVRILLRFLITDWFESHRAVLVTQKKIIS
jgi:protein-export membrane protein SecD